MGDSGGTRLVCPVCGESKRVERRHFLDDDGKQKVELTCDLFVHEEAVVHVFDDPDAPPSSIGAGGEGLVHDLELYDKLVEIVYGFASPVEYGVVEFGFAGTYPGDYEALWRRFGHVHTHGSKRYTLSSYLGGLLGTLSREGSVSHLWTVGTGRWVYNDQVSAWSHPARADEPIVSWVDYASSEGIDPETWPPLSTFPRVTGEMFWAYDNWVHDYTKIHRADCSYCNDGQGMHPDSSDQAGEWLGPFGTIDEAMERAAGTGRAVSACQNCAPG